MKCDDERPASACEDLMVERIRYFAGRHMTARDFEDADAYHRTFRHLHNRVLHGWGVACGLQVMPHPRLECRRDWVRVRCGLALDCCGREIVVHKDVFAPRIPWNEQPADANSQPQPGWTLILCLHFEAACVEKVPVLYSSSACASPAMQDGRIREGYVLHWLWVRDEELDQYGWHSARGCAPKDDDKDGDDDHHDDHHDHGYLRHRHHHHHGHPDEEPCDKAEPCCLEPLCPKDHCVVLAIVHAGEGGQAEIDMVGRRSIASAREHLTHICWTSWPHGGIVKASELEALRVRFDRPLHEAEHPLRPGPRGINERTFVVQYGEQSRNLQTEDVDFVEFTRPPHVLGDRRTAVYEILKPETYLNHIVHVTLKCDFILDCHGNPVDGDHLRGRLPSGDGVAGGTFESWFHVVDDDRYDKVMSSTE